MGGSKSKLNFKEKKDAGPAIEDRRLDFLARLLEIGAGATCIAVAVVNGTVVIAENSLMKDSKGKGGTRGGAESMSDPALITKIKDIYAYFQNIANGNLPSAEERMKFFTKMAGFVKPGSKDTTFWHILGAEVSNNLIKNILENEAPRKLKGRPKRAAAYAEWQNLYSIITELEKSILSNDPFVGEKPSSKISEYREALKKDPEILRTQSQAGVHAELQILDHILINRKEKKIEVKEPEEAANLFYIGVSKLCCRKCNDTIVSINVILREAKIHYEFDARGYHKVQAGDKNWVSPDIFKAGGVFSKAYQDFLKKEFEREIELVNQSTGLTLTLEEVLKIPSDTASKRPQKKQKKDDAPSSDEAYSNIARRYERLQEEINGHVGHSYIDRPLLTKNVGYQAKESEQYPSPSNSWTSRDVQNVTSIFSDIVKVEDKYWPELKKKTVRKFEISLELIKSSIFQAISTTLGVEDSRLDVILRAIVDDLNRDGQIGTSTDEVLEVMQDSRFVGEQISSFFLAGNKRVSLDTASSSKEISTLPHTGEDVPGPSTGKELTFMRDMEEERRRSSSGSGNSRESSHGISKFAEIE